MNNSTATFVIVVELHASTGDHCIYVASLARSTYIYMYIVYISAPAALRMAMALALAILAPQAPEVPLFVFSVTTIGTSPQGISFPLMMHLDSDSVVDVDVDVEVEVPVDVMDDSSVMVVVTQGLAALMSSLLQPRLVGGSRNVIFPSTVTVQPGHDVAL